MVLIFYKLLFRKKKYDKFEIFSAWYRRRRRTRYMLTDTKLRNLKPRDKLYKVNDREGLYVAVTPAGSISFRYNYSINGRQETITFGRYGVGGITLRSEEHTSELQSRFELVCRLLLENKHKS